MTSTPNQDLGDLFDQKVKPLGALVARNQLNERLHAGVKAFTDGLAKGLVHTHTMDTGRDGTRHISFSGYRFLSVKQTPFSFIEVMFLIVQRHLRTMGRVQANGSILNATRRAFPVVYNQTHLRQRLRERLLDDTTTPEQKFYDLPHHQVVLFSLFYLEAMKRGLLTATDSMSVGIPTPNGILIGRLGKNMATLPERYTPFSMASQSNAPFGRVILPDYADQVMLSTFIDYNSLGPRKEKAAETLDLMNDNNLVRVTSYLFSRYVGTPEHNLSDMSRIIKMGLVDPIMSRDKSQNFEETLKLVFSDKYMDILKGLSELADEVADNLRPPPGHVPGSKMAPVI